MNPDIPIRNARGKCKSVIYIFKWLKRLILFQQSSRGNSKFDLVIILGLGSNYWFVKTKIILTAINPLDCGTSGVFLY